MRGIIRRLSAIETNIHPGAIFPIIKQNGNGTHEVISVHLKGVKQLTPKKSAEQKARMQHISNCLNNAAPNRYLDGEGNICYELSEEFPTLETIEEYFHRMGMTEHFSPDSPKEEV